MLTVTSVNVNGLRAAAKKGFVEWLADTTADVLCLQEVRAEPQQLPEHVRTPDGWHVTHAPAAAEGREVVVCGDWNIAHREADLKNWRANKKNSGFLPEERDWLSRVLDPAEGGYVDVVRALHPDVEGPYSWWSYRGRAFENDSGWRIDYHVATPGLAARAVKGQVERAATHAERWSDHAPVTVVYER
ncbi:exodeoxyribonuclease III [Streptomyces sp. NPDC057074]|uniref:exodeoxyribonuclease III n=1 Tax=Streptomyces sp. NPDC057074 TaxID=3346015 RepID=UPI00363793AE